MVVQMVVQKPFDRYMLTYIAGASLQSGGPGSDISCYQGNVRVGLVRFFQDGTKIPPNKLLTDGTLVLYYEISRFSDVIETLRYEKPLMLVVNSDTGFGYISSAALEPIGEQEAA